jgi:hypothetical protein
VDVEQKTNDHFYHNDITRLENNVSKDLKTVA